MTTRTPLARLRSIPILAAIAISLAFVALTDGGATPVVEADAYYNNDIHFFVIRSAQSGGTRTGNVTSSAGTWADVEDNTLMMTNHDNSASVLNGKCGTGHYPFCWGAINNPGIRYYHSGNSYTLDSDWTDDTRNCLFGRDDHGYCFINGTDLAWFTWPVTADGYRNVPIRADYSPQWYYAFPCCGPSMTPHTDEYDVG